MSAGLSFISFRTPATVFDWSTMLSSLQFCISIENQAPGGIAPVAKLARRRVGSPLTDPACHGVILACAGREGSTGDDVDDRPADTETTDGYVLADLT